MKMYLKITIICLLILNLFCFESMAQSQDYLDGTPKSQQVLEYLSGQPSLKTYSKQMAALHMLSDILLKKMDNYKNAYTIKERAILKDYTEAIGNVRNEYSKNVKSLDMKENLIKWNQAVLSEKTTSLETELIDNLFSEQAKDQYYKLNQINKEIAAKNRSQDSLKKAQLAHERLIEQQKIEEKKHRKLMAGIYGFISILLIAGHFIIRWKIRNNQWGRTNKYGVQEFQTKTDRTTSILSEGIANVFANLILIIGLVLMMSSIYQYTMS